MEKIENYGIKPILNVIRRKEVKIKRKIVLWIFNIRYSAKIGLFGYI